MSRPTYRVAVWLGRPVPRGNPELAAELAALPMHEVVNWVETRLGFPPCPPHTPNEVKQRRTFVGPPQKRTHCINGHPFEGKNLCIDRQGPYLCRRCRECSNARQRKYYKQRRYR